MVCVTAQVSHSMAQTLCAAAAFAALLFASLLGSVSAGVQFDTGLQYPGITGAIPACAPEFVPQHMHCALAAALACQTDACAALAPGRND